MKLLKDLGVLALGTRFAVLADQLFQEVQSIYRAQNISFDPRNFLLFYTLSEQESASVSDLADAMNCTHARASQKLTELAKEKLVESAPSDDARKSCYRLSKSGKQLVAQLQPVWSAIESVLANQFEASTTLAEVVRFEQRLEPGRFAARVLDHLAVKKGAVPVAPAANLTFRTLEAPISSDVSADFKRLTVQWLKEFSFPIEAADEKIFSNLSGYLMEHSGLLVTVEKEGKCVGVAILLKRNQNEYELSKFCVDKRERGSGLGKRLFLFCEAEARLRGAKVFSLETNTKLKAAVTLYESYGFKGRASKNSPYTRVNFVMQKKL